MFVAVVQCSVVQASACDVKGCVQPADACATRGFPLAVLAVVCGGTRALLCRGWRSCCAHALCVCARAVHGAAVQRVGSVVACKEEVCAVRSCEVCAALCAAAAAEARVVLQCLCKLWP